MPEQEEQRHAHRCAAAKANELPLGQIEEDFGLYGVQVLGDGYIGHLQSPPSVAVEQALGKRTGLKKCEAQKHRIAHTAPDGRGDIRIHDHVLYKHGVDGNTDDNEEALKAEGKQASEVVLSHLTPFPVHCRRHGDRGDGGHKIDFYHAPVHDDEDADVQRVHGESYNGGLQPQAEQRPDLHFIEPCFQIRKAACQIKADIADHNAGSIVDHALRHIEYAHNDIPGVADNEYRTGRFEHPLEDEPGIDFSVHVVFVRNDLNQLHGHYDGEDHTGDGQDYVV